MTNLKPIEIIGGGLAGLTLGIALRRQAVPVRVVEAANYPRQRVCGEFINGRGLGALDRLGLGDKLRAAGAVTARTARFFTPDAASPRRQLAEPALAISRYALDDLLAQEFRERGGELCVGERWRGTEWPEGTIRATGRRANAATAGLQWYGLKIHARQITLTADLEMHLLPSGYVGLCALSGGEVNICGLFRRDPATGERPGNWRELLRGPAGSRLHERLREAIFLDDSFCSVAGLSLRPRRAEFDSECSVGDSVTMIPPVTGNGMSMAFESAELATGPLLDYCQGHSDWASARRAVATACDRRFASRLAWARRLQWLILQPRWQGLLLRCATNWPWLWSMFERKTR